MRPLLKTQIAKMRHAAGIKQESLARDLDVNPNYYARVERGELVSKSLSQRAIKLLSHG